MITKGSKLRILRDTSYHGYPEGMFVFALGDEFVSKRGMRRVEVAVAPEAKSGPLVNITDVAVEQEQREKVAPAREPSVFDFIFGGV